MDKNLNSNPKLPWWVTLIQLSPLILQLVGEITLRMQGVPQETVELPKHASSVVQEPGPDTGIPVLIPPPLN